jgi:hypothetical protein
MTPRSIGAGLIASFIAGALLSGSFVTFAFNHEPAERASLRAFAPTRPSWDAGSRIDRLRNGAASGDALANEQLATALLDRYDALGDADDLYEALVWVDRDWNAFGSGPLVARVFEHYCAQRVVRWHWFCVQGE